VGRGAHLEWAGRPHQEIEEGGCSHAEHVPDPGSRYAKGEKVLQGNGCAPLCRARLTSVHSVRPEGNRCQNQVRQRYR